MRELQELLCAPDSHAPVAALGGAAQPVSQDGLDGLFGALFFHSGSLSGEVLYELERRGVTIPDGGFRLAKFCLTEPALELVPLQQRHLCRMNLHLELRTRLARELAGQKNGGYGLLLFGFLFVLWFADAADKTLETASRAVLAQLPFGCQGFQSVWYAAAGELEEAVRSFSRMESGIRFYGSEDRGLFVLGDADMERLTRPEQRVRFEQSQEQWAERVCGALAAQDRPAALAHFRRAMEDIIENCRGLPYPTTLRNCTLRFWETLQYHLADENIIQLKLLRTLDFSRSFMSAQTAQAYLAQADAVVDQLLEQAARQGEEQRARRAGRMADYVRSIALRPDACLTMVAQEFRLEPRDIAAQFRQFFGCSVRDMIHKTRLQRARQLLTETQLPIQEIAGQVGYCSLTTMYRAFGKYEGAAPGKLRGR